MKSRKYDLKMLTFVSILLALSVTLKLYSFGSDKMRFSLFAIPLLIAGTIAGPLTGGLTGLLADVIYGFFFSQYPFNPFYTVSMILWGVAGGLLRKKGLKVGITRLTVIIIFTSLLETTINTLGMIFFVDPLELYNIIVNSATGYATYYSIISSTAGPVFAGLPVRLLIMVVKWPILIVLMKNLDERFVVPFFAERLSGESRQINKLEMNRPLERGI